MARTRLILAGALLLAAALASFAYAATASAQEVANAAPRANFKVVPKSPSVGQRTKFNGNASTDSDGAIVSYAWDYGDGTTKTESDPTSFHTYDQPGTYTATLRVTDNQGCTAGDPYTVCTNSNRSLETKTVVVVDRGVLKPNVRARTKQVQDGRRIRVEVEAGAAEAVRATAYGHVRIRGRRAKLALVPAQADVAARARATLGLKLRSPAARKRVAKALNARVRVQATVTVQLVDAAGNEVRLVRTALLL